MLFAALLLSPPALPASWFLLLKIPSISTLNSSSCLTVWSLQNWLLILIGWSMPAGCEMLSKYMAYNPWKYCESSTIGIGQENYHTGRLWWFKGCWKWGKIHMCGGKGYMGNLCTFHFNFSLTLKMKSILKKWNSEDTWYRGKIFWIYYQVGKEAPYKTVLLLFSC